MFVKVFIIENEYRIILECDTIIKEVIQLKQMVAVITYHNKQEHVEINVVKYVFKLSNMFISYNLSLIKSLIC